MTDIYRELWEKRDEAIAELEQALAHERGLREQLEKRLVEEAQRGLKNGQLREAAEAELARVSKLWNEVRMARPADVAGWRAVVNEQKARAEAAEAELQRLVGELNTALDFWVQQAADIVKERNALTAYASRLLAALTQQREALELISNPDRTVYPGGSYWDIARAALATDTAALEAEGETLGVAP